jgi:hypothetical protein
MRQKPNNAFKKTHIPVKHKNKGKQKASLKSKFILQFHPNRVPHHRYCRKTSQRACSHTTHKQQTKL